MRISDWSSDVCSSDLVTTGSTFLVASSAADGTIEIARTPGTSPATPYSAGARLHIQAANIVQGGSLRLPLGALTLGSSGVLQSGLSEFAPGSAATPVTFAPAKIGRAHV